jgi:hypothetical protein
MTGKSRFEKGIGAARGWLTVCLCALLAMDVQCAFGDESILSLLRDMPRPGWKRLGQVETERLAKIVGQGWAVQAEFYKFGADIAYGRFFDAMSTREAQAPVLCESRATDVFIPSVAKVRSRDDVFSTIQIARPNIRQIAVSDSLKGCENQRVQRRYGYVVGSVKDADLKSIDGVLRSGVLPGKCGVRYSGGVYDVRADDHSDLRKSDQSVVSVLFGEPKSTVSAELTIDGGRVVRTICHPLMEGKVEK